LHFIRGFKAADWKPELLGKFFSWVGARRAGVRSIDKILDYALKDELIMGITFGRENFKESLGLARSEQACNLVYQFKLAICKKNVERGLEFGVGGSFTRQSVPVLQ
jgi:hypothetical protein